MIKLLTLSVMTLKKKVLVNGECKCEGRWFDDPTNELCKACHYSG